MSMSTGSGFGIGIPHAPTDVLQLRGRFGQHARKEQPRLALRVFGMDERPKKGNL
jgi:hypothetical protein